MLWATLTEIKKMLIVTINCNYPTHMKWSNATIISHRI